MIDTITRERIRIPVAELSLAAELAYPEREPKFASVLVNPHPHMGGSMENNLITMLAAKLASGGVTLRFDYRGVGESDGTRLNLAESLGQFWRTGHAPEDPLMIDDARAAIRWIGADIPRALVVIGYSFGAYAAVQAIGQAPAALVLISPTITQHDFSRLVALPCAVPTLLIYSDNDFATPPERTRQWAARLPFPVVERCYSGAEHFLRGREADVAACCGEFIASTLRVKEAA